MSCKIEDCTNKHKGHGYCQTHYERIKRNGDLELHYAKTHGLSHIPEYNTWTNMKARCYGKNLPCYKHYGGRGIRVCDEWRNSFEAFLTYVGRKPTPKHTIDRIDVNKGYEPGNVRWATRSIQQANMRPKSSTGEKYIGFIKETERFRVYAPKGTGRRHVAVAATLKEAIAIRDNQVHIAITKVLGGDDE